MTLKRPAALAAALLLAVSLTACGSGGGSSSSSGDYCSQLKDAKDAVNSSDLSTLTDSKFQDLLDQVKSIQSNAPSSVSDDWQTFADFLTQFQSILTSAGISMDDLSAMQSGTMPSGVSMAKLQQAMQQLKTLDTSSLSDAQQAIADNAKSDCNIDLVTPSASSN